MKDLNGYLVRGHYASRDELRERIPELHPLKDKSIAVFGLGCLGAPSALEFAKAGIRRIHLVDHDTVDPATAVRWPVGFRAAGHGKADLLHGIIRRDYPYTESKPFPFRMGRTRSPETDSRSDMEIIEDIFKGVDLVYDATAELGVQHFLSDRARALRITYIGVAGTLGGWGGKVFRIRPHPESGCWLCYQWHCQAGGIPEPPSAPDQQGRVQPAGCADPTFTGAGFDMLYIALAGVRMAVSTLCEGATNAYPKSAWDVLHIRLRGDNGTLVVPTYATYEITRHPECRNLHVPDGKQ
ncbi:ThiF family adenylyltransferase [Candidatus Bathyarchaeota archaeon]|nr:ThiF family adenylyltransferase [Candidatus Bathyarchaeota archaeon]